MVKCQVDRCIGQQVELTRVYFRGVLNCLLRDVANRVIIIDNGQQFTWFAYIEVDDAGKLKEVSSYIQDCLGKVKNTPLGQFMNGLKVLSAEGQQLFLFDKEVIAVKVLLVS
ncbi:MAG: hypothetical protein AT713_02230 [Caldivirga sp. JCHS_4]|jgi:hypothetical protein|nr:MAG: hypothetical protein AT713_02230 [Caldivirga sp. JCHS_4]